MREGRQGCSEFDVNSYRKRYADLRKAFGDDLRQYYIHYIMNGKNEGRIGTGTTELKDPETVYEGIDYSPVYDYEYYIQNNADIKRAFGDDDIAVLSHFVNNGMSEGRRGNEEFNVETYRKRYIDLRNAFGKNLKSYYMHYLKNGRAEGRSGSGNSELVGYVTVYEGIDYSPIYDYNYYISHYPDIKNIFEDDDYEILKHFIFCGMSEGRTASENFNVYIYKANYPDLQNAYGNNLTAYYMHYLNCGKNEGRTGSVNLKGEPIFHVNECVIDEFNRDEGNLSVSLSLTQNNPFSSSENECYIILLDSTGSNNLAVEKGILTANGTISITATFTDDDSFKAFATGKYAVAIKEGDFYRTISDSCLLKNPEELARKDDEFKDKYWGYYEGYKVYSKKGIQDADEAYTADLGVQHVLLNADIQDLVSASPQSGYIPYTYKGNTYYFSDLIALKNTINDLHGWGNTEGGYTYGKGISRNVTLVLLMSWKHDELSYLIHPAARIKGAAPYYSLNMQDENARNTFEALFCYMGEELGQMKTRVSNWTLGNELNSCNAWNYAGSMSFNDYVANYAEAFKMLHQAVRRTAASPRLFISLDHCWNVAEAGYSGKAFLDTFASYMNQTGTRYAVECEFSFLFTAIV